MTKTSQFRNLAETENFWLWTAAAPAAAPRRVVARVPAAASQPIPGIASSVRPTNNPPKPPTTVPVPTPLPISSEVGAAPSRVEGERIARERVPRSGGRGNSAEEQFQQFSGLAFRRARLEAQDLHRRP